MIYMTGDVTIIVLETANVEELRKGRPIKTPDGKVLIAWTPDMEWLATQIAASDGDGRTIGKLVDDARTRDEKPAQTSKDYKIVDFK